MSEKEMTFVEHIIELRNRLKVIATSFVLALIFWMAFPRDLLSPNPGELVAGTYRPMINFVLERTLELAEGRVRIIGDRDFTAGGLLRRFVPHGPRHDIAYHRV